MCRKKNNNSIICSAVSASDAASVWAHVAPLFYFPFLTVVFYWGFHQSVPDPSEPERPRSQPHQSHIVTRKFNLGSSDESQQMEKRGKKLIFGHVVMDVVRPSQPEASPGSLTLKCCLFSTQWYQKDLGKLRTV